MNKHLQILNINLVVLVALVLTIELFVRIAYPEILFPGTDQNLMIENRFGETRGLQKNAEGKSHGVIKKVDEHGFWFYSNNQKSKKSILLLGDSVTMGIGVEPDSTFAGKLLTENDELFIYNPSLIGYSSLDYLNVVLGMYGDGGPKPTAEEVLIFWCLNDLYETSSVQTLGFDGDSTLDQFVSFFRNHFKTFHLLKKLFTDRPLAYYQFDKQFYESGNPSFTTAIQNLTTIDSVLSDLEIELKVILLPYEYQLRNEEDKTPQNLMKSTLKNHGIPVYDTWDFLYNSAIDSEELYLFGDGIHFSNTGHALIAQYITAAVLDH